MNVQEYLNQIEGFDPSIARRYRSIYGDVPSLIQRNRKTHCETLRRFMDAYGSERDVLLIRCPSRINLMGMHIEHKGGYINPVAIGYEITMVASKRSDDLIRIKNVEPELFPAAEFSISSLLPSDWKTDWLSFISSAPIERGHWQNYVRSAALRLQMAFPDKPFYGMDIMVSGDIPRGGGVSSSSALVVSSALAVVELNELPVDRKELTVLCGEGEWYVGTRGGAGDQGAMLLGKRGSIAHIQFFPLRYEPIPLPENHLILLCRSYVDAHKASGARSVFNERVSTYDIALMLIRKRFPEVAEKIRYVRDVSPKHLDKDECWIYKVLRNLPERMTRDQLFNEIPEVKELEAIFKTHDAPPDGYMVRQVLLYGISEAARGDVAGELLAKGKVKEFGRLMGVSHNGDRVVRFSANGVRTPHCSRVTDDYLDGLIEKTSNGVCPEDARLHWQPGGYACSHERVDQIVDILMDMPGVLGARLTGAGLGGCLVALVAEDHAENAILALNEKYYGPHGLPEGADVCVSVDGAGVL